MTLFSKTSKIIQKIPEGRIDYFFPDSKSKNVNVVWQKCVKANEIFNTRSRSSLSWSGISGSRNNWLFLFIALNEYICCHSYELVVEIPPGNSWTKVCITFGVIIYLISIIFCFSWSGISVNNISGSILIQKFHKMRIDNFFQIIIIIILT